MEELWTEREETLLFEEEPILTYKMKLPDFSGTKKGEKRLQRYYSHMDQVWLRYFTETLYQGSCVDLAEKREKSRVFTPWNLSFLAVRDEIGDDLLSVGLTAQIKKGKHVTQCRFFSELWDRKKGYPKILHLQEPLSHFHDHELLEKLLETAKNQDDIRFKEDYQAEIQKYFSKKRTFFTNDGIFAFFHQGAIAAPEEGILKFMLFSENYSSTH